MSLDEVVLGPDDRPLAHSQLTDFTRWCETRIGQKLSDHAAMDRFSVREFRSFWRLFLEWCHLPGEGAVDPVCVGDACETARFFPNLRLNYAECLLAGSPEERVLTARHGDGSRDTYTRGALRIAAARLAARLERLGVRRGDHVVAIARNNAEAIIAAMATAATGATFASCASDMGVPAILARFAPLDPVVLFGCLKAEPWDSGVPVAERVITTARACQVLLRSSRWTTARLPSAMGQCLCTGLPICCAMPLRARIDPAGCAIRSISPCSRCSPPAPRVRRNAYSTASGAPCWSM
ncbi:AMP-binding protein [Bradyrhizobium iriomotense]|uniref:AMP-binding protein n=1 Tax=Bradyrhizobium iriomotense TaxID=441950 RepID=UPI0024E06AC7|nr:AMP-binding protein [Bradyrhizobium iriomotense]